MATWITFKKRGKFHTGERVEFANLNLGCLRIEFFGCARYIHTTRFGRWQ